MPSASEVPAGVSGTLNFTLRRSRNTSQRFAAASLVRSKTSLIIYI